MTDNNNDNKTRLDQMIEDAEDLLGFSDRKDRDVDLLDPKVYRDVETSTISLDEGFAVLDSTIPDDSIWCQIGSAYTGLGNGPLRREGINHEGYRIEIVEAAGGGIMVTVEGTYNYDRTTLAFGVLLGEVEAQDFGVDLEEAIAAWNNAYLNTGKSEEANRLVQEAAEILHNETSSRDFAAVVYKSDRAVLEEVAWEEIYNEWEDITIDVVMGEICLPHMTTTVQAWAIMDEIRLDAPQLLVTSIEFDWPELEALSVETHIYFPFPEVGGTDVTAYNGTHDVHMMEADLLDNLDHYAREMNKALKEGDVKGRYGEWRNSRL